MTISDERKSYSILLSLKDVISCDQTLDHFGGTITMTSWMFQWPWYDITASTAKSDIGVEIEDEESIMFIVAKSCNALETKRGIYMSAS
jgi:hypothetical protein